MNRWGIAHRLSPEKIYPGSEGRTRKEAWQNFLLTNYGPNYGETFGTDTERNYKFMVSKSQRLGTFVVKLESIKRYVLWSGEVTSKTDGQRHFICFLDLARLYGVSMSRCVVGGSKEYEEMRNEDRDALIPLFPRYDGNYRLPTSRGQALREETYVNSRAIKKNL